MKLVADEEAIGHVLFYLYNTEEDRFRIDVKMKNVVPGEYVLKLHKGAKFCQEGFTYRKSPPASPWTLYVHVGKDGKFRTKVPYDANEGPIHILGRSAVLHRADKSWKIKDNDVFAYGCIKPYPGRATSDFALKKANRQESKIDGKMSGLPASVPVPEKPTAAKEQTVDKGSKLAKPKPAETKDKKSVDKQKAKASASNPPLQKPLKPPVQSDQ